MEINRIEFDDKDDPESGVNNPNEIRFTIGPEGMVIALPNGGRLGADDQKALGNLLRMAYEQGKRIGSRFNKIS